MTKETSKTKEEIQMNIQTKEYNWSWYAFGFDLASFSTLTLLVCLLMFMHKTVDSLANMYNWKIILVAFVLELIFAGFSVIDAFRHNPKDRFYDSRIFNLPVLTITVMITMAIFWGNGIQYAVVYGAISGGFAGYLAGGLAYANFFIKIEDTIYRTIFGGWVGVFLGAIFGALFAGLVDPFAGKVFGGIFMGFWGGAIVSGPIATILLYFLKDNEKFRTFFTKMMLFDVRKEIKADLIDHFNLYPSADASSKKINLKLDDCIVLREKKEPDRIKSLEVLYQIAYLISPWDEPQEENRIETFRELFEDTSKELDLKIEDNILSRN